MSTTVEIVEGVAPPPVAPRKPPGVFRRALRLWRVRIGLILLGIIVAIALFGPLFAPYGETEFVARPNTRNASGALFGTDYLGQDVWSRFLYGGRSILLFAIVATALGLTAGVAVGLVAALNRGRLDEFLMRSIDVILAFPSLLLALVAITTLGPKTWLIIGTVAVTTTPRVARVTRGAAVSVVERDFVASSEALGESRWRILRSDLLPNVSAPLLVEANLRLTYSIATISALAFLGFASEVNSANWGLMVNENRTAVSIQPWGVVLPTIAIAILTIGTGLIADGMARANAGIDRDRGDA